MSRIDRAVQRVRHHLADDEVLLACALGLEIDGRRRQVLMLTDKRAIRVGLRGERPDELPVEGAGARFDEVGDVLTITGTAGRLELRDVERGAAERIERLLGRHRSRLLAGTTQDLHHIRIVSA